MKNLKPNKRSVKPVHIFPEIYDITPFLKPVHPVLHPLSDEYERYWLEQERKIVEGIWGLDKKGDKGGYRHMPGSLNFFIWLGVVSGQSGEENTDQLINPALRDIDWVMHYGYALARGFSGFIYDEYETCHRSIKELELKGLKNINPVDKVFIEKFEKDLITPKGNFKKYVNPLDYLYNTKPEPLGRGLYQNEALNFILMGPRGFGKSWMLGNIFSYEYRVSGIRTFDDKYLYDLPPVNLVIMSSDSGKSAETVGKFLMVEKHLSELCEWQSDNNYYPGYFHLNSVGQTTPNNIKTPYMHKYAATKGDMWDKNVGTGSRVYHLLCTAENPDVGVGLRPIVILHEEAALAKNEDIISKANQNSLKKETFFGSEITIATGGNLAKIGPMKKKFLNPELFRCVPYPDVYFNRKKPIGCMIPVTHVKLMFKDPNGNTKLELAWEAEQHMRKLYENDPSELAAHKIYNCMNYEEMFGGATDNVFPVEEISYRITEIESTPETNIDLWAVGEFVKRGEYEYEFFPNSKYRSRIMDNPENDKKTKNDVGVVIMQHPMKVSEDEKDVYFYSPYKITYDVIKDEIGGTSLTAIIVYKGFIKNQPIDEFTDNIVAYYVGRHEDPNVMHEIAINLAKIYNCKILYENNIDDFLKFCRRKKVINMLQPTPWLAIDKVIKNSSKKKQYGVDMQAGLKQYALRLALKKIKEIVSYEGQPIFWIERVKMLRLLYELTFYGELDNYDALSAFLLLVIWLDQEEDPAAKSKYEKEIQRKKNRDTIKEKVYEDEQYWGSY